MIKFIQHKSNQYPPRTYENASADCTIAFAFDFNTPGEKLTYDAAYSQGKSYIDVNPIDINNLKIKTTATILSDRKINTINITGNSLPTVIRHYHTQLSCDTIVYLFLEQVFKHASFDAHITLIRSGGQSGFDESGLKAAVKLGIPALCLCPQGWKFRDENGTTICDEQKFKNRFDASFIL